MRVTFPRYWDLAVQTGPVGLFLTCCFSLLRLSQPRAVWGRGGLLTDTLALAYIKEAGLAKMASVELNLGLTQLYKKHQVEFHWTQLFYVQQRMRKSLNRRFLVSTPRSVQVLSVVRKSVFYVFDMVKFYTFPYSW